MWLGPAPWAPYNHSRCDGNFGTGGGSWRSYRDYSGGGMTDWGAHHFGGALYAVDLRELEPEEVVYHDDKDGKYLTYRFPNGLLVHHNHPGMGNLQVVGTPGRRRAPKTTPTYKGTGGIYGDFLECVKTRQRPFRDIELATHTMTVAHLGIIAYDFEAVAQVGHRQEGVPGRRRGQSLPRSGPARALGAVARRRFRPPNHAFEKDIAYEKPECRFHPAGP